MPSPFPPDHTHANIAMAAMDRNIHLYVQKPLTHNIKEARLLTETAREKKIVTQMGIREPQILPNYKYNNG